MLWPPRDQNLFFQMVMIFQCETQLNQARSHEFKAKYTISYFAATGYIAVNASHKPSQMYSSNDQFWSLSNMFSSALKQFGKTLCRLRPEARFKMLFYQKFQTVYKYCRNCTLRNLKWSKLSSVSVQFFIFEILHFIFSTKECNAFW